MRLLFSFFQAGRRFMVPMSLGHFDIPASVNLTVREWHFFQKVSVFLKVFKIYPQNGLVQIRVLIKVKIGSIDYLGEI
jgi:hypothetical protein